MKVPYDSLYVFLSVSGFFQRLLSLALNHKSALKTIVLLCMKITLLLLQSLYSVVSRTCLDHPAYITPQCCKNVIWLFHKM